MKKNIFTLLGILGISCTLILIVFYQTKDDEVLSGGFYRKIIHLNPDSKIESRTPKAGAYIAGVYADSIYLGNIIEPNLIEVFNYTSRKSKYHNVPIRGKAITKSIVRYPYLFQVDEANNQIIRINLTNRNDVKGFTLPIFTDAIPLTKNSFAFRSFDDSGTELQLSAFSRSKFQRFPQLLQKQIDGVLCTDGMLIYNQEEEKLFYTYYYRNQFICMDTSMNLLFRGKTIDSISQVKIKVAVAKRSNSRALGSPARLVNRYSYSSDSLLFIVSNVIGKNERPQDYRKGSMIDCYSTRNGQYLHSLYLPNYKNEKVRKVAISHSRLFALDRYHLVTYALDNPLLTSARDR